MVKQWDNNTPLGTGEFHWIFAQLTTCSLVQLAHLLGWLLVLILSNNLMIDGIKVNAKSQNSPSFPFYASISLSSLNASFCFSSFRIRCYCCVFCVSCSSYGDALMNCFSLLRVLSLLRYTFVLPTIASIMSSFSTYKASLIAG